MFYRNLLLCYPPYHPHAQDLSYQNQKSYTKSCYFLRKLGDIHIIMRILLVVTAIFFTFCSCTTNHEVDLIVYNAKVYTVDSTFKISEAFAVRNGVFIEIGTSDHILTRYEAKEKIDAQGKPVYPGFYDAHAHFMMFADGLEIANLTDATSFDEVIHILREYDTTHPNKKWIIGKGWDQNRWPDRDFPTKDSLDKYFPETPVFLTRIDYHAAVVNSRALQIAAIDSVFEVEGGLISQDSLGGLSGLLLDNAIDLVRKHIPDPDDEDVRRIIAKAQDSLFSVGLTSIVDAGMSELELERIKNFYASGLLTIRNYAMIQDGQKAITKVLRSGTYDDGRLTMRAIKIMGDGALGSRGACLLEPYSDDEDNTGFMLQSPESFDQLIRQLAASNFQVATHAIGDSTVRFFLDTYAKHLPENNDRRWRIEHAQIVSDEDFAKFGQYRIIPSVQPTHATSDMYWAADRLGPDRIGNAYAYRNLLDSYGMLAIGSDFPVEGINPLYGFHAAVARVDAAGMPLGGFQIENAISRDDALRGMTIWAAYACFQEGRRGSIERGKDADFVMLDDDIMLADVEKLRDITVIRTVIAGKTVFSR